MSGDRPTLPPVRLNSEAELARDALAAPLFTRAVRLARWAGPGTRVGAGGELADEQLPAAAAELGLGADEDGAALASEAWRLAVDTGLVDIEPADDEDDGSDGSGDGAEDGEESEGTAAPGENLALITSGSPQEILALWLDGLETVHADAIAPQFDDFADLVGDDGEIDFGKLEWDPDAEAEFLDGVLGNLYLLTVTETGAQDAPVPLPALAASMIVPDDMGEPTDDVLEQVSEAMMRLDDQFSLLEPIGLVEYHPVDEALLAEEAENAEEHGGQGRPVDDEDVSRYGMVRLTPLGLYGIRARMLDAGVDAPAVGELADKDAGALLDALARFPEGAARAETVLWLDGREPAAAAAELLSAARGEDSGAPLRRLHCQQALSLVADGAAEHEVREVLDDAQLGGLARVWLAERGAADVPAPPESMIFWLAIDTLAAQLDADGEVEELQGLVEGLTGQHSGFFDAAWRVEHPATADVLEAMGRLHPDRKAAKDARKAAFKARSRA